MITNWPMFGQLKPSNTALGYTKLQPSRVPSGFKEPRWRRPKCWTRVAKRQRRSTNLGHVNDGFIHLLYTPGERDITGNKGRERDFKNAVPLQLHEWCFNGNWCITAPCERPACVSGPRWKGRAGLRAWGKEWAQGTGRSSYPPRGGCLGGDTPANLSGRSCQRQTLWWRKCVFECVWEEPKRERGETSGSHRVRKTGTKKREREREISFCLTLRDLQDV